MGGFSAGRTPASMAVVAAILFLGGAAGGGESGADRGRQAMEMSPISGPPDEPRRHFRLRYPAELTPDEAAARYEIIRGALRRGYARSELPAASSYQRWRRYNRAPYLSSSHGNHYLNNYANDAARAYGKFEEAGVLPVGSVIAKDSFAVTQTGGILLGPLFIMKKMPAGFNYASGDWQYALVQPDGTLLGETNGRGSERVEYCIGCHLAVEDQDHLYFVPRDYRVRVSGIPSERAGTIAGGGAGPSPPALRR